MLASQAVGYAFAFVIFSCGVFILAYAAKMYDQYRK